MKKITRFAIVAAAMFLLAGAVPAFAVPTLQLYTFGGTYDTTTETWVASGPVFDLGAYLYPEGVKTGGTPASLSDTFYLSMALMPKTNAGSDYGYFTINGTQINVTSDMFYGTPPIDAYLDAGPPPPAGLAGHGIFETYFTELAFTFDAGEQVAVQNMNDLSGGDPAAGTGMYEKIFAIDLSGLADGYNIHFDLYNEALAKNQRYPGDLDAGDFAPFSHDAEGGHQVPEPGTLVLFGSGLVGLVAYGRKRFLA